jgi:hypothetical protein
VWSELSTQALRQCVNSAFPHCVAVLSLRIVILVYLDEESRFRKFGNHRFLRTSWLSVTDLPLIDRMGYLVIISKPPGELSGSPSYSNTSNEKQGVSERSTKNHLICAFEFVSARSCSISVFEYRTATALSPKVYNSTHRPRRRFRLESPHECLSRSQSGV